MAEAKSGDELNIDPIVPCKPYDAYFGDGAGAGADQLDPKAAHKVGAGVAALSFEGDELTDIGFAPMSVPGKQAVPRAELVAAAEACSAGAPSYFADARYVVPAGGWARINDHLLKRAAEPSLLTGANSDLWAEARQLFKKSSMSVDKVTSHMPIQSVKKEEITLEHYFENGLADVMAKAASTAAAIPFLSQREARKWAGQFFLVCMRACIIDYHIAQFLKESLIDWEVSGN